MRKATATLVVATVASLAPFTAARTPAARQAGGQGARSALDTMVEAERAFSRLSGRIGQLPAFLAYFADDVVTFQPTPVTGKDGLRALAATAPIAPVRRLDWEPWFADIAQAGDLGFTTGPSVTTEISSGKTLRTGWYFSIWKHDANGWRVAADIGIGAPPVGALRPKTVTTGGAGAARARAGVQKEELLALERKLSEKASASGLADAYGDYLLAATRLYRDGTSPVVGPAGIRAYLADKRAPSGWKVLGAAVAASGDLAYTYGLYGLSPTDPPAAGHAAFLHVWKGTPNGWRLAAEVVNGPQ